MRHSEGICFIGRTGSGKSTALRIVVQRLLKKSKRWGYEPLPGCLWFTAKPDEADIAENIILGAGRGRDLIRYDPGPLICFNPLTYEMTRKGGSAVTLSQTMRDIHEVVHRADKKGEDFWEGHFTTCMMHGINVTFIALRDEANFEAMYQIIASSPETTEEAKKPEFRQTKCGLSLVLADQNARTPHEKRQVVLAAEYFMAQLPAAGEKVRGAVLSQVLNTLLPFTMPPLSDTVNGKSNFDPETAIKKGRCIILDFDVLTHGRHGLSFQLLMSFFFLEAVLRRRDTSRPFIFVRDEYQRYCHPARDVGAQGLARSQNFISIAAFQTLPILTEGLGGGMEAKVQAKSLYACHVHKYMLNNNCVETNEENSKIIGMNRQMFMSSNMQHSQPLEWWDVLGVGRPNVTMSQQYHYRVPPMTFQSLATGGKENNYIVQAIVHDGFDYSFARFKQR